MDPSPAEKDRTAVLRWFYDQWAVHGVEPMLQGFSPDEIRKALDMPKDRLERALQRLGMDGFAKAASLGPTYQITPEGVRAVEQGS